MASNDEGRGLLDGVRQDDCVCVVWDDPAGPIVAVIGTLHAFLFDAVVVARYPDDELVQVPVGAIRTLAQIDGPAQTMREIAAALRS